MDRKNRLYTDNIRYYNWILSYWLSILHAKKQQKKDLHRRYVLPMLYFYFLCILRFHVDWTCRKTYIIDFFILFIYSLKNVEKSVVFYFRFKISMVQLIAMHIITAETNFFIIWLASFSENVPRTFNPTAGYARTTRDPISERCGSRRKHW